MRQSVKHNEQRTVYVIHIYSKISVRLPRVSVGFSSLTRSASLGRSKWPLEPEGSRKGARARSQPQGRSKWPLELARPRWGARNGRS
jgi:hypothetical protein